jgi:hypothetical protein
MLWDGMADALSENSLNAGAEGRARVTLLWVATDIGGGGSADAEDVRPLLDFLPEVLRVECGVASQIV